jgi:thiol-disulfide isomerase/thioredoxin
MKLLQHALLGTLLAAAVAQPASAADKDAPAKSAAASLFDASADAPARLRDALAAARKDNRRVLVLWGMAGCDHCQALADRLKDAKIAKTLRYEYDLVAVEVGKSEANRKLAAEHGANLDKDGPPHLTVLGADGKPLAQQPAAALEAKADGGKPAYDAEKLQAFLTKHQAPYLKAEDVFTAGLAEAKRDGKQVFLHFGAPWCGWCIRMEQWLARPEIAPVLAKDFVDVKIDMDRTTGAKEVLTRYNPSAQGGIPWFVILDVDGKAVVTSDGPKGNIGYPGEPHEIAHFCKMLETARHRMTADDVEALRKSLVAAAPQLR